MKSNLLFPMNANMKNRFVSNFDHKIVRMNIISCKYN